MSADGISDAEPETTATAQKSKSLTYSIPSFSKTKRSYNTVESSKRQKLIRMVNEDQMTIKEAASRLKINYSTAKHIIKSQRSEATAKPNTPPSTPSVISTNVLKR